MNMPVQFTVDVGGHLFSKNEPCRQVIVVFNPGQKLAATFVSYGQIFWIQTLDRLKFVKFDK
jgi:hypothetical protein